VVRISNLGRRREVRKMEAQGLKSESREKLTREEKPSGAAESRAAKERSPLVRGKGAAIAGTAAALAFTGGYLLYRAKVGHGDFFEALGLRTNGGEQGVTIKKSVIVNRSPEEVFSYWRNFENFPNFMKHVEAVRKTGKMVSHWVTKAPGGKRVEWDSEITEIKDNELIRWRSLSGSDVQNRGQVTFKKTPEGGTGLEVEFTYQTEGATGSTVSRLFNFLPVYYIRRDLQRFKRIMEKDESSMIRGLEKTLAQT
jgi:uncharacterized membrane protein